MIITCTFVQRHVPSVIIEVLAKALHTFHIFIPVEITVKFRDQSCHESKA